MTLPSVLTQCLCCGVYLLLILAPSDLHAQATDTGVVTGSIEFRNPSPSCGIYGVADLNFGTLEKPITGALSVTVDASDGTITTIPAGHSVSGHTVGMFRVSGSHANSYIVTQSPAPLPTTLVSKTKSSDTISLSTVTRISYDGGTTWSTPSQRCYSGPCVAAQTFYGIGGGPFSEREYDVQIGGTISGIQSSTPEATYSTSITFSLTCS